MTPKRSTLNETLWWDITFVRRRCTTFNAIWSQRDRCAKRCVFDFFRPQGGLQPYLYFSLVFVAQTGNYECNFALYDNCQPFDTVRAQ